MILSDSLFHFFFLLLRKQLKNPNDVTFVRVRAKHIFFFFSQLENNICRPGVPAALHYNAVCCIFLPLLNKFTFSYRNFDNTSRNCAAPNFETNSSFLNGCKSTSSPTHFHCLFFVGLCTSWHAETKKPPKKSSYSTAYFTACWWAGAKETGGGECSAVWKNSELNQSGGQAD